jgi:hypothetical protein
MFCESAIFGSQDAAGKGCSENVREMHKILCYIASRWRQRSSPRLSVSAFQTWLLLVSLERYARKVRSGPTPYTQRDGSQAAAKPRMGFMI